MKTTRYLQGLTLISTPTLVSGRPSPRGFWIGPRRFPSILLAALFVLAGVSVRASDPIGVFAKIDKVVFEPNEGSPERIQLWGAFSIADLKNRDTYLPPQKGYLYYQLPGEKSEVARKEWNDLKAAAGSGDVIGLGSRRTTLPKVRDAKVKADNPDIYSVAFGLVKAGQRPISYPPIKALQATDAKAAAPKEKSQ